MEAVLISGGNAVTKSLVVKRSVVIVGHKTSVTLEDAFWQGLKEIAIARATNVSNIVESIDAERERGNLSSCIRLFVLGFYRHRPSENRGTPSARVNFVAMHK